LWKDCCVDNACAMNDSFIIDNMVNVWIPYLMWKMDENDWIVGKIQLWDHFVRYYKCAWMLTICLDEWKL
jgi:hypothetical protein